MGNSAFTDRYNFLCHCSRWFWKNIGKTLKISQNEGTITEKKVEKTVIKGEIAHLEQFLLLPQCFWKTSAAEASENVYMRESDNKQ